jgi:hypothetical protein
MLRAFSKLCGTFRLLLRAQAAFTLASRGEDARAFAHLKATAKAIGPFTEYPFGIEPTLLDIYLKGCLAGLCADDYDWFALRERIVSAWEYNAAEKLHLIVYLEELATTAGVSLSVSDLVSEPAPTERVRSQLLARFPKLSQP